MIVDADMGAVRPDRICGMYVHTVLHLGIISLTLSAVFLVVLVKRSNKLARMSLI